MAKFDLAAKLKEAASNLNTPGAEQIEYIPFDLLDPDETNFYSIDGLNDLADSIATVGILTPLRVRANGERYTITSGHRRRAAVKLLIDSGEDWSKGLPCIVDRGETTPEWEELKLIFANRQRVKTSAELSREAERTDELFCALREKGYEFPGRMQEHVAQALGVKASKLKRLHAIRGNLIPELLALYDANKLNEETAYQLQQLPEGVQRYLAAQRKVKAGTVYGTGAKACVEKCEKYLHPDCKCPDGSECTHTYPRLYQTITADMGYWRCNGECCLKCNRSLSECPYQCKMAKDKAERKKEKEKAEKKAAELSREEEHKRQLDENRAKLSGQYMSLAVLAKAAGVEGSEYIGIPGAQTMADLEAIAANPSKINDFKARDERVFDRYCYVSTAQNFADRIGVSVDFLLGRTEEPGVNRGAVMLSGGGAGVETSEKDPSTAPLRGSAQDDKPAEIESHWSRGTPTEEGWYACLGSWKGIPERTIAYFWDGAWYEHKRKIRVMAETVVTAFYRLPDVEEV